MIQQGSIKIHPVHISPGILCEMNTHTRLENFHRKYSFMDQYIITADVTHIPEILVIVIIFYVQFKTFVLISFFHCR